MRRSWLRSVLFALVLMPCVAYSEPLLSPDDPDVLQNGELHYVVHCAACHGKSLEGEANWKQRKSDGRMPAPPHDETGHTWHHTDEQLFALTKFGPARLVGNGYQSNMPGYEGVLTDKQILDILSYIKSTWPERIRRRHDAMNQQ